MVLPVFVSVVFFIALLISYPWHILSFGSVLYLLSLPWGWKSYRDQERVAAATESAATAEAAAPPGPAPTFPAATTDTDHDDRPVRLN
jgi:CDP-diacylglycerol--serine O-phosphatidyltransferase